MLSPCNPRLATVSCDQSAMGYDMFKFLFGKKGGLTATETQRETVERVVKELNEVLVLMADKPKVGVDLNSGLITLDLPEQMPDEALALPAPEEKAPVDDASAEEQHTKDAA